MKKYLAGLWRRKEVEKKFESLGFQNIALAMIIIFWLSVITLGVYLALKFNKVI